MLEIIFSGFIFPGGGLVTVGGVPKLGALVKLKLLCGHICRHSREVSVDESVGVPLPRLAGEATVVEAGGDEHLPDCWVSPVVGHRLGPNADVEVVVAAFEVGGHGPVRVPLETDHVLPHLFESLVERLFVVLALALPVADEPAPVADEDQDTAFVHSVQARYIGDTVRVQENESELRRVEYFVVQGLEVPLGARARPLVLRVVMKLPSSALAISIDLSRILRVLIAQFEVVFHVLPAAELLQHDHLIAAVFGRLGKQCLFLLVLRRIDNVTPLLLVLGLEVPEELVEGLVTLGHRPDARIERLSLRRLLRLDELLKLLDLGDSLGTRRGFLAARVFLVCEEKHLVLVVLALVLVGHHL